MPVEAIQDVVDEVTTLGGRLTEILGLAESPNLTHEQAKSIVASLEGAKGDCRAILADLDSTQDEDLLIVQDGAILMQLWTWHRETRRALVRVIGTAQDAQDVVDEFTNGTDQKVVVTKQGDTLQKIAHRELGDWREWPRLLQANPSLSVGFLAPGTSIVIPEKR